MRREMEAAAATPSPKPSGARKAVGGGGGGGKPSHLPPSSHQQRGKATHNKPTAGGPRTAAAKSNAHFIERRGGHIHQARCRDSVPCSAPLATLPVHPTAFSAYSGAAHPYQLHHQSFRGVRSHLWEGSRRCIFRCISSPSSLTASLITSMSS